MFQKINFQSAYWELLIKRCSAKATVSFAAAWISERIYIDKVLSNYATLKNNKYKRYVLNFYKLIINS